MEEHKINLNGTDFFYRTNGKGAAVVLLHGFGEDSSVWEAQYDLFPDNLLIIPDLPGSGASGITKDMSMEGLAGTVVALLDLLKIEKCILIGHSMGGYITLAFAEKYSHRLHAFGLFHSTAYADGEEKKETSRKGIAFIRENGAFAFLKTAIPNLYGPETKEQNPGLIQKQLTASKEFRDEALIAYYEAIIRRPDRTKILEATKLPVLFIIGVFDNAVPMQDVLEQCHIPSISYVHILEHSGHMCMQEETDRANQSLLRFVQDT